MRLSLNHRDIKKQRFPGAAFVSILLLCVKGTGPGIIGQEVIIFDFTLFQMEDALSAPSIREAAVKACVKFPFL